MARCCSCNGSKAHCIRCSCVKSGCLCASCRALLTGICQNTSSDLPSNQPREEDDIEENIPPRSSDQRPNVVSGDGVESSFPFSDLPWFKHRVRTVKNIPRAACPSAACRLSSILSAIVSSNNLKSPVRYWLVKFPSRCLRISSRGGKCHNLPSLIKKQESDLVLHSPGSRWSHCELHLPSDKHLAARVSSKLSERDVRGAIRLACSEDSLADASGSTVSSLISKYPSPHPDSRLPAPPIVDHNNVITLSETEVREAILLSPTVQPGVLMASLPSSLKIWLVCHLRVMALNSFNH